MNNNKLFSSGLLAAAMLLPALPTHAAVTHSITPLGGGLYQFDFQSDAPFGFGWASLGDTGIFLDPQIICMNGAARNCNAAASVGGPFVAPAAFLTHIADNHARGFAQKFNISKGAILRFGYYEQICANGNSAGCFKGPFYLDPALLDVKVRYGHRTLEASGGILPGETRLTITNGDLLPSGGLGLTKIGVWINGVPVFNSKIGADAARRLDVSGATQPLVFDISKFVPAEGESTIVVEGIGDKGATASIVVGPNNVNVVAP